MKTYKAYIKQRGEGCDYTIGCAQTVLNIVASSMEEAKQKLYETIKEEYYGERELESAELYEIENVFAVDLNALKEQKKVIEQAELKRQHDEQEKKEFERLKTKFGNG